MEQYGSVLSRQLESFYSHRLDIHDLIDRSRSFISLIIPFIKLRTCISELISWKNFINSFAIFICGNLIIFCTTNVIFISLVSLILAFLIFIGMMHRKTGILKKVFPSHNLEEFANLSHDEAMHDLHIILVLVDSFVHKGCIIMLKIFSIMRWENLALSIIIYSLLFGSCIILSVLSLRFYILYFFNISFCVFPLLNITKEDTIDGEKKPEDAKFEETCSRNSEIDPGIATDEESSMQGSISSEDEKDEDKNSQFEVNNIGNQEFDNKSQADYVQVMQSTSSALGTSSSAPTMLSAPTSRVSNSFISQQVLYEADSDPALTRNELKIEGRPNTIVGKLLDLKRRRNILTAEKCNQCGQLFNTLLKRKNICSNCGLQFCAKCCNFKVPRYKFGATAPAAQTETAIVCSPCYESLTKKNTFSKDE